MNIDRAVAILPTIAAMSADDRKLLKASMDAGLPDVATYSAERAEVDGVIDFLSRIATTPLPS